jgi:hypothetical protein
MVLQQQAHATRCAAGSQIDVVGADHEVDCVGREHRTRQGDSAGAKAITAFGGPGGRQPLEAAGRRGRGRGRVHDRERDRIGEALIDAGEEHLANRGAKVADSSELVRRYAQVRPR